MIHPHLIASRMIWMFIRPFLDQADQSLVAWAVGRYLSEHCTPVGRKFRSDIIVQSVNRHRIWTVKPVAGIAGSRVFPGPWSQAASSHSHIHWMVLVFAGSDSGLAARQYSAPDTPDGNFRLYGGVFSATLAIFTDRPVPVESALSVEPVLQFHFNNCPVSSVLRYE